MLKSAKIFIRKLALGACFPQDAVGVRAKGQCRQSKVKALLDLFSFFFLSFFLLKENSLCKEAWSFSLQLPKFPYTKKWEWTCKYLSFLLKLFSFSLGEQKKK